MLKNVALLFVFSMLLATIGVAQEDGWTTLPAGQSVYGIRYDQHGAIIVNNDLVMGCVVDPQSPDDTKVYISPPSPLKKYVMVMCWDRGGKEAYVIDTRNNRVVSRDVVPKHWRVIKWVSWSPDERFALVTAAGEITMGDMAFVDLTSGKLQEINFRNFTNNRGIDPRKTIHDRIQDFDPDKVSWLSLSSFRLNMDVRCNPYEVEGDCYEKVISSHPVRVNLSPFSIGYGNIGQARGSRVRQGVSTRNSQTGRGIRSVDFRNFSYQRESKSSSNTEGLTVAAKTIVLHNGKNMYRGEYTSLDYGSELLFIKYIDFDGDGNEEALVAINTSEEAAGVYSEDDYFVFAYRNGTPVSIFQAYRYKSRGIRLVGKSLVISAPFWRENDGHCCPSAIETSVYRWRENGFVRVSNKFSPMR